MRSDYLLGASAYVMDFRIGSDELGGAPLALVMLVALESALPHEVRHQ